MSVRDLAAHVRSMTMIRFLQNLSIAIVGCYCFSNAATAQKPDKEEGSSSAKEYRWQDEAQELKLSDREIELLRKNKLAIGEWSYKQIFTPYLGGKTPVFITADSVLNGFHVLLEESIYRMEK